MPVFFFALMACEVLGPCRSRQVLQHGVCAELMGAHPSVIIFGSLDLGKFLLATNRIVCTACVYVCVHKSHKVGFVVSIVGFHRILPLCH